jgi:predicted RNA-binding protein with PUA-like domain
MKSEPDVYSIDDLAREGTTLWDGIRNYQARNFMRAMQLGDRAFFYHSNCTPPGIVGLMEVCETGLLDPTQFDSSSKYFDAKSKPENPRWDCVRLRFVSKFSTMISLDVLKTMFVPEEFVAIRKGNRLSVSPVSQYAAKRLLGLIGSGGSSLPDD